KPAFNPNAAIADKDTHERALRALEDKNVDTAIPTYFYIPKDDSYVYHAIASITLAEVQALVHLGDKNGLQKLVLQLPKLPRRKGISPLQPPSDITSYASIFLPSTSTPAALRTFTSNARKSSILHLPSRLLPPHLPLPNPPSNSPPIPKSTNHPCNPYLTFLVPTFPLLQWCGPTPLEYLAPHNSHPILPVHMHHFSCVCPSHDALTFASEVRSRSEDSRCRIRDWILDVCASPVRRGMYSAG
ncbi:hypothetical protein B0T14DRAFT_575005, partial [Immersiella caudata]